MSSYANKLNFSRNQYYIATGFLLLLTVYPPFFNTLNGYSHYSFARMKIIGSIRIRYLRYPFPISPLALLTAQQDLLKYMYLFVSYMPYSRTSQYKKIFYLEMQFKDLSNQITIALIIYIRNFKILIMWWLFVRG